MQINKISPTCLSSHSKTMKILKDLEKNLYLFRHPKTINLTINPLLLDILEQKKEKKLRQINERK